MMFAIILSVAKLATVIEIDCAPSGNNMPVIIPIIEVSVNCIKPRTAEAFPAQSGNGDRAIPIALPKQNEKPKLPIETIIK